MIMIFFHIFYKKQNVSRETFRTNFELTSSTTLCPFDAASHHTSLTIIRQRWMGTFPVYLRM